MLSLYSKFPILYTCAFSINIPAIVNFFRQGRLWQATVAAFLVYLTRQSLSRKIRQAPYDN